MLCLLIYTGIESVFGARKSFDLRNETKLSEGNYKKTLFSGFLMSVSNPMTILFWLGIYGSVLAEKSVHYELYQLAAASLAIIAGIALWDFSMAGIAGFFRKWLTNRLLRIISVLSGFSQICFGGYFGYDGIRLLIS